MDDQQKLQAAMAAKTDPWEVIGRHLCYSAGIPADEDWRRSGAVMLDVADDEPANWQHKAHQVRMAMKAAGVTIVASTI